MITNIILTTVIGLCGGALLGSTRSCEGGGCPLTATPLRGAIYGGVMGLLLGLSMYGQNPTNNTNTNADKRRVTMSENIKILDNESYESTIAEGVTLVDFWAPWCGPCQMQIPILDEVAAKIGDKATVAKVNVDDNQQIAVSAGVQSIPTLIVFKDGKVVQSFVGVQQAETLVGAIESALK